MNWDLKFLDRFAVLLVFLLLLKCALVVLMKVGRTVWLPFLAPFVVWPASSMFLGTRTGRWLNNHARAAIFLFMTHGLMLLAFNAAFRNLYSSEYAFYVWMTLPILVAIASQSTYKFLDKFFPTFLAVLMGGRKTAAPKVAQSGA
jgi:hypothetical protein